jgi:uncharacterized membrane protein
VTSAEGFEGPPESRRDPDRLEAFSDGVMAVIITITAFGIEAPNGATWHALAQRLPALLVYVLSFTYVGIYWNNHHHLLRATVRIDGAVMWANLHLLFWLSLVPVLTRWVATDYRYSLPASMFGVAVLGAAVAYSILTRTIVRCNGADSGVAGLSAPTSKAGFHWPCTPRRWGWPGCRRTWPTGYTWLWP